MKTDRCCGTCHYFQAPGESVPHGCYCEVRILDGHVLPHWREIPAPRPMLRTDGVTCPAWVGATSGKGMSR